MRAGDRTLPPIVLDTVPAIATWPVRPVLAIAGRRPVLEWDAPDLEWDRPGADGLDLEWDEDLVAGFTDATCVWTGLETDTGNPDEHGRMASGRLVAQLDNTTGAWSQYNLDGTLAVHGPGFEVLLWATDGVDAWWLFAGEVTRWDERADQTVEVEAFDVFSDLAQTIGTYTPGTGGQTAGPRAAAILASAGRSGIRNRFAAGAAHLTAQPSDQAPLEELQTVVASDGGRLFTDADGTLVSLPATWRAGRTDQTAAPVISSNVCSAPLVVWDAVISTNDDGLADTVIFTNVAGLRAQTPAAITGHVFSEAGHQWTTQAEGDSLAAATLGYQNAARLALDEFDVYVLDRVQHEVWRTVDWRLFDRLRFLHDAPVVGGIQRVDVDVLVTSLGHTITPDSWVIAAATSRAVTYHTGLLWDTTVYVWEDPSGDAIWGY